MYPEIFTTFCFLIFSFLEDIFLHTTFTHTHTHDPRPLPTTHDPRHLATLENYISLRASFSLKYLVFSNRPVSII